MLKFKNFIKESNMDIDPYKEENWNEDDIVVDDVAQNHINGLYYMYIKLRKDEDKRWGANIVAQNAKDFVRDRGSDINNWKKRFINHPYVIDELDRLEV